MSQPRTSRQVRYASKDYGETLKKVNMLSSNNIAKGAGSRKNYPEAIPQGDDTGCLIGTTTFHPKTFRPKTNCPAIFKLGCKATALRIPK